MPYIDLVTDDAAAGEATVLLDSIRASGGDIPNFVRLFAHRPQVYRAWRGLVEVIMENTDLRRYELATIAAARQLGSSYCMLAQSAVL